MEVQETELDIVITYDQIILAAHQDEIPHDENIQPDLNHNSLELQLEQLPSIALISQPNVLDFDNQNIIDPDLISKSFQSCATLMKGVEGSYKYLQFDLLQKVIMKQFLSLTNQAFISLNVLQNDFIHHKLCQTLHSSAASKKIYFRTTLHKLFPNNIFKDHQSSCLKNINFIHLIKTFLQKSLNHNVESEHQSLKTWSILFFSHDISMWSFVRSFVCWLLPLNQYDILSYQRLNQLPTFNFILFSQNFQQVNVQKMLSQVYVNCGQCDIQWLVLKKSDILTQIKCLNFRTLQKINQIGTQVTKIIQKPKEVVLIPSGNIFSWKISSKNDRMQKQKVGVLVNWEIMSTHTVQVQKLIQFQQDEVLPSSQYLFYDVATLITDFVFHQYSKKQLRQNLLPILNYINKVNNNQKQILSQVLSTKSEDYKMIFRYLNPIVNVCCKCKSFIYNYFAQKPNNYFYCVHCLKQDKNGSHKLGSKYPLRILNQGYLMLKEAATSDLDFSSTKISSFQIHCCDGRFVGSTNTKYCDVLQNNNFINFKLKDSQKIQNGFRNIQQCYNWLSVKQLIKILSQIGTQSAQQKSLILRQQEIIYRFLSKKQMQKIVKEYLPQYDKRQSILELLKRIDLG